MLTERQIQLLEAIIEEYLASAEPVGSSLIVEKYNVKCSPATVRNEMAVLLDQGYLQMMHTSSGRVPTTTAYKFFLTELMEEESLDVLQEVALKQRLWGNRHEFNKMLRQATLALAELTNELALITTEDGMVSHAGTVNILDNKEFWDIEVAKTALHLLDRYELLEKILSKAVFGEDGMSYIMGDDIEYEKLKDCAFVVAKYEIGKRSGYISVFGPSRMKYQKIIPAVRYTKNLVEELGGSW